MSGNSYESNQSTICTFPDFTSSELATNVSYVKTYLSFIVICSFVIVIANSVVLVAMVLTKKLHKSRYVLIFNLCISDLFVGLLFPVVVWGGAGVGDILGSIVTFVSMLTILSIAIERFIKIVLLPYTKKLATSRQLIATCGVMWLISAILFLSVVTEPTWYAYIYHFVSPVILIIIFAVIIVLYLLIFLNVSKQEKGQSHRSSLRRRKHVKTKRVLHGFALIIALYCCCYLPWAVESLRIGVQMSRNGEEICWQGTVPLYFTICIGILNSALNPFIYWRRLPDFNEGMKAVFQRCRGEYDPSAYETNDSSSTLARNNSKTSSVYKENNIIRP
ncbi:sphingosine 1-phosphate receptor 1-like [Anneissia japonica]|uniref:sphingosine 1-phosphate receptor 1-like n=1 Tax=Anneissia japonica TaxID=1529436 RepID=UPI001425576B|nr:sphingosine 1-phosphate receptor 1-like [Anneissia japonica]XP_033127859.1 sphingosine 1-phosphate receptor 1-like [Anneissia japonica]